MSTKKAKYNEVYISGEIVDISNAKIKNQDQSDEKMSFTMKVDTGDGEIVTINFDNNKLGYDGNEDSKYVSALKIYEEGLTRTQNGQGDIINCSCKVSNNRYYSEGKLVDYRTIKGEYCNRQKEGKQITPGQIWRVDALVKGFEDKEDSQGKYLEVELLINDYISVNTGKVKGCNLAVRIHNQNAILGFKEMYDIGSIGKMWGVFKEAVIQEEIKKRGFGKGIQARPQVERWMELEGGDASYNTVYDENTLEIKEVRNLTDSNHPFSVDNIEKMQTTINEYLEKSKEKDATKMANTQTVNNSDVPF